jgi:hypothetical protein
MYETAPRLSLKALVAQIMPRIAPKTGKNQRPYFTYPVWEVLIKITPTAMPISVGEIII